MFDFFKKNKFDIDRYKDDLSLNEQWIEHYFVIGINAKSKDHKENIHFLEELNHKVMDLVAFPSIGINEIDKSISIFANNKTLLPIKYKRVLQYGESDYYILIRFPNAKKSDLKKDKTILKTINKSEKRSYDFSPLQSLKMPEICKKIEFNLCTLMKLEPHELQTLITGVGKEVMIHEFDGLQYHSYPLSKRAKLFSKYPELDEILFGTNFIDFAKWIISKETDSEIMKRNTERTREILRINKINI